MSNVSAWNSSAKRDRKDRSWGVVCLSMFRSRWSGSRLGSCPRCISYLTCLSKLGKGKGQRGKIQMVLSWVSVRWRRAIVWCLKVLNRESDSLRSWGGVDLWWTDSREARGVFERMLCWRINDHLPFGSCGEYRLWIPRLRFWIFELPQWVQYFLVSCVQM